MRRQVIVITDGDLPAQKAVQETVKNIGGHFIAPYAGNSPPLSFGHLVHLIKQSTKNPVVVALDDRGHHGIGNGENALAYLAKHPDIDLIGVVAVASNIEGAKGTNVDFSITNEGRVHSGAVDKNGYPLAENYLIGDTVSILSELSVPVIVGTGDTGKMSGKDSLEAGAPITLKAIKTIWEGFLETKKRH